MVQVMKLLITQFSPVSFYLISLGSKYSLQRPLFKLPHSIFFLNVIDKVSHPYKTTGKITDFVYFNINDFTQQARRQKALK
jgi:hypothetical protein